MPISAVDSIGPAFQHTKQQIAQPFRMSQWARLAIVGFLAGELPSGGCNTGFQGFQPPTHTSSGTQNLIDLGLRHTNPALYAGLIALLVVCGIVLWLLLLYVNSVMRFVLFDSIIRKRCQIRRDWGNRQTPGWRLFGFQLLFTAVTLAGVTILIGIPAAIGLAEGWLKQPKQHLAPLILGGIVLFFLVLAFVVTVALIHVMTKDFVVPQMALENVSAFEAWRRLLPRLQGEKGGYAAYVGMKIVMDLGAAVVLGIVSTILILVLAIPLGGLGVLAVLLGKSGGLVWNAYTITAAVLAGVLAVALIVFLVSLISVPAIVFFPAYSIYFFAARYPALSNALYPPPPAPPLLPDAPAVW